MNINFSAPEEDREIISEILGELRESKSAYITWHARPDGDAVGGGLALYQLLCNLGVPADMVSPTAPPSEYSFLKNYDRIRTCCGDEENRDLCIVLDCSNPDRLEEAEKLIGLSKKVINIDHHRNNRLFGDINYIRSEVSSVCEIVMNIASESGIDIDHDFAMYIYVGLITDTNRFQEKNTTPRAHLLASELVKTHVSPVDAASLIYGSDDIRKLKLISKAIETLKFSGSGRVGYIVLTPGMIESSGMQDMNIEGIINYARNIKGVEVGVLFRQLPGIDGVKASFRSKGRVNVERIAGAYGGGGHHNAAGCLVEGGFAEAVPLIINAIEKELQKI